MAILDIFRKQGEHLYWQTLEPAKVDRESGAEVRADDAYFVVRLAEMYLGRSRTLWRKAYPLVHAFTKCGTFEEHNVAGPGQLDLLGGGNLDRVIVLNTRLAGPIAYKGGDVNIAVGLWSVPGDDTARALVSTVGAISALLGGSAGPVPQVVDIVKTSVEHIIGLGETKLRLGIIDTFSENNPLRSGFHVGIGAPVKDVNPSQLWLHKGRLLTGANPVVAKPYQAHDYVVVGVERLEVREDWPGLPGLEEINASFAKVIGSESTAEQKRAKLKELWPTFVATLSTTPYLTRSHARKILADVAEELTAALDSIEHGNPFETKAWASGKVQTSDPRKFDFAEVADHFTVADAPESVQPFDAP